MILYFSGTGNSRWAARQLAEHLGDGDIVSVNDALREGSAPALRSERPFVVVAPTYAWRLPRVVDAWLRDARLEGSRDVYFVLTCGGSVGNAAKHARALCRDKGLRHRGLAEVVMPENYVALYDVPDEETCERLLDAARSQLEGLAARIAAGEPLPETRPTAKDRLRSGPVNAAFYPALVHDRAFAATDACTSCGLCAARCPLNNIALEGGRPVWKGTCTHCMACIGGCPAEAIEYGEKSKGRRRYYLKEDARA